MSSTIRSRKDLMKEKEESLSWDLNPSKKIIQDLLGGPLSELNYRKYTKEQIAELVEKAFLEGYKDDDPTKRKDRDFHRLIFKVKKAASRDEAVLALGDFLLA
jgi:hypothetical protein